VFRNLSEIDVKKKRAKDGSLWSTLMYSARLGQLATPNKLNIVFIEQVLNKFTYSGKPSALRS